MFVYAKKPFTDDDDDDDEPADDDFCSGKAGGKKHKKKKVEYPSSKKAAAPPKKMIMIDCDGSDDEKFVTTATNKAISDVSRLMAEINSEEFKLHLSVLVMMSMSRGRRKCCRNLLRRRNY